MNPDVVNCCSSFSRLVLDLRSSGHEDYAVELETISANIEGLGEEADNEKLFAILNTSREYFTEIATTYEVDKILSKAIKKKVVKSLPFKIKQCVKDLKQMHLIAHVIGLSILCRSTKTSKNPVILWVDDKHNNNASERAKATKNYSVKFELVNSTEEALQWLASHPEMKTLSPSEFRIITDSYRPEDEEKAASNLIQGVRKEGWTTPILVYGSEEHDSFDLIHQYSWCACTWNDVLLDYYWSTMSPPANAGAEEEDASPTPVASPTSGANKKTESTKSLEEHKKSSSSAHHSTTKAEEAISPSKSHSAPTVVPSSSKTKEKQSKDDKSSKNDKTSRHSTAPLDEEAKTVKPEKSFVAGRPSDNEVFPDIIEDDKKVSNDTEDDDDDWASSALKVHKSKLISKLPSSITTSSKEPPKMILEEDSEELHTEEGEKEEESKMDVSTTPPRSSSSTKPIVTPPSLTPLSKVTSAEVKKTSNLRIPDNPLDQSDITLDTSLDGSLMRSKHEESSSMGNSSKDTSITLAAPKMISTPQASISVDHSEVPVGYVSSMELILSDEMDIDSKVQAKFKGSTSFEAYVSNDSPGCFTLRYFPTRVGTYQVSIIINDECITTFEITATIRDTFSPVASSLKLTKKRSLIFDDGEDDPTDEFKPPVKKSKLFETTNDAEIEYMPTLPI